MNLVFLYIDDASLRILHCLAVGFVYDGFPEQITERMARLEQIAMRLEVKRGQEWLCVDQ